MAIGVENYRGPDLGAIAAQKLEKLEAENRPQNPDDTM